MNTISVKQLRTELPHILNQIEKGESFILIYRSKPIGELIPMGTTKPQPTGISLYDLLQKPFGEVRLPKGQSSVERIRSDRR